MGFGHALQSHMENSADHHSRLFVHNQLLSRRFPIAIGGVRGEKFSLSGLHPSDTGYFLRQILTVQIMGQIFKCHRKKFPGEISDSTVKSIIYRDKPNPQKREHPFQIGSDFYIIPAKPGQILDDDAVDFSQTDLLHEPFERISVEVCSCFS